MTCEMAITADKRLRCFTPSPKLPSATFCGVQISSSIFLLCICNDSFIIIFLQGGYVKANVLADSCSKIFVREC